MKILYFSHSYGPHDHRFLSAMVEAGHRASFLRLHAQNSQQVASIPAGVIEMRWSGKLEPVIEQVQPEMLHAGPLPTCGILAAKSGFHPLVVMSWGSDLLWEASRHPLTRRKAKAALRAADAVIGDCEAVRAAAVDFGARSESVVTFPWGVDLQRFIPTGNDGGLRASLGWQDQFVLLHLRAWEPLYDPQTVASAFVRAAHQDPRLRLLMPGTGRLSAHIRRLFNQHQLSDRVHLPGQLSQTQLPDIFRASDLYISASQSDGSSVSLLEALASGLPALVSDIAGNREWVRPGKEGWLFPVKDVAALADLMLQAATGAAQLKPMSVQARRTAEERADWSRNKEGLFAAYDLAFKRSQ
jgi:glycosyltransferase involved in cell wall biosynthesis